MTTTTEKAPEIGDVREITVRAELAWECFGDSCGALNMQTDDDGGCIECGGILRKVWVYTDADRETSVMLGVASGI